MAYRGIVIMMSVLMLGLVACGTLPGVQQRPAAGYPFRHNAYDLKIAWKTDRLDRGIVIDGLLKNVRYQQIEDVEVTVSVVDKDNKTLASDRTFLLPFPLKTDEYAPFGLTLKDVALANGDVFRFLIKYRANDDDFSSFTWLSNFKADAITGATINEEVDNPDRW